MSKIWKPMILISGMMLLLPQSGMAKPPKSPTEDLNSNALLSLLTPKTIFVTSDDYDGDLVSAAFDLGDFGGEDGLAAADHICQYHADMAGLKGKYKAVLSSSYENASARISTSLGPYRLVDGTPVAENHAALFSTRVGATGTPDLPPIDLIHAVRRTETGLDIEGGGPDFLRQAWTGSRPTGAAILTNTPGPSAGVVTPEFTTCEDWTSSEEAADACSNFVSDEGVCGSVGQALSEAVNWLDDDDRVGCNLTRRLYCAEQ